MKKIVGVLLLTLVFGCKTASVITSSGGGENKSIVEIIDAHNDNAANFKTSNIRGVARYSDSNQSQNVNLDIRIKKDEIILVTIKVMGFTVAKAHLTPTGVQFYEKMNNRYYDGDFEFINSWLGMELDFYKVQNLLVGKAIHDLDEEVLQNTIEEGFHKLVVQNDIALDESYYFETEGYLLKKEELGQSHLNRMVTIRYPSYQNIGEVLVPAEIEIEAKQEKSVTVNIRYDKVTLNEDLNFPFTIPAHYTRINLN